MILSLIFFASPVWKIAPPTTKRPIIITTILLEKPLSASCGVKIPATIRASKAHNATISERNLPEIKNIMLKARIANVIIIIVKF